MSTSQVIQQPVITNTNNHPNHLTDMPAQRTATTSAAASASVCPYPTMDVIRHRAHNLVDEDDFDDLGVSHQVWANSVVANKRLRDVPATPRLRKVLKRWLTATRPSDKVISPEAKMGLMASGVVGVELLSELTILREEVSPSLYRFQYSGLNIPF